jgi:hypothetical protein
MQPFSFREAFTTTADERCVYEWRISFVNFSIAPVFLDWPKRIGSPCRSVFQLGETLDMAIATVNRTLQRLRSTETVDFGDGIPTIKDWEKLVKIGGFDPRYLHLRKVSTL